LQDHFRGQFRGQNTAEHSRYKPVSGRRVVAEFRIEAGFEDVELVSGSIRGRADHRRTGRRRFRVETDEVVNTRLNEQATRLVVEEGHRARLGTMDRD
jgi:hypothetical protein